MPRVLNKYRDDVSNAVYCGRGSPYGNPFVIGPDGDRDTVCDRFEREILPDLDVSALRGRDLWCFCKPKRCHCDPILKKANAVFWTPYGDGPNDGITFSLLSKFLVCRHRFWHRVVLGLSPDRGFDYKIEFGNLMHIGYEYADQGIDVVRQKMVEYARKLGAKYPENWNNETKQIGWWLRVCQNLFPIYQEFHNDDPKSYVFQEQTFRVPIKLPSGRTIIIRGKWDGVRLFRFGKSYYLKLQENKNKGTVDKDGIRGALYDDLQTQIYANTFSRWLKTSKEPWAKRKFTGVLYNIVRRPLGDWHAIRQKVKETPEEFADRAVQLVREKPDDWFTRYDIGLDQSDIDSFEQRSLFPILESLCDWWDSIKNNPDDPWYTYIGKVRGRNPQHWLRPHGVYDGMFDGLRGDFDGLLERGSMEGLARVETLFPELTE